MIIFNDFKARFYYEIVQRQNVVIVPHCDVDSLCATFILTRLLDADEVQYSVIPVKEWSQLRVVFEEHKQIKNFVLLNCGGFRSLLEFNLPSDFCVFVIDVRRPFHLDNVFNENVVKIVCHESEVKELNLPRADEIFDDDASDSDGGDGESDEDDSENRNAPLAERIERRLLKRKKRENWRKNRDHVLWKYSHKAFMGLPTSVFLLKLAHSMSKTSAAMTWCAAVGLSSLQVDHSISTITYSTICIETMKPHLRQFGPIDKNKADPTLRVSFDKELTLPLYRHWNLDESIRHDVYFMCACRLWTQRGRENIKSVYANNLGIPLKECENDWEKLSSARKKEIFDIIDKRMKTNFASFFSHKGYARWFSATDFARVCALGLQFSDPIRPHSELFMQSLAFLRDYVDQYGGISKTMTTAINHYKAALGAITRLAYDCVLQKRYLHTPSFIALTIGQYVSELDYLRSAHCLQIFVYIALRIFHATKRSDKRLLKPLFVAILDPNQQHGPQHQTLDGELRYFLCSGSMPLGDMVADPERKSFIPRIFEEIAEDRTIHSIYDNIDPNVILVREDSYVEFFARLDTRLPSV